MQGTSRPAYQQPKTIASKFSVKPMHSVGMSQHARHFHLDPLQWRDILVKRLLTRVFFGRNRGIRVLQESWDNLIILDACRYDAFEALVDSIGVPGVLESRISRASYTPRFLEENFPRPYYDGIVYVTANPHVSRILAGKMHAIVPVWKWGWNRTESTVLPQTTYDYATKTRKDFPDKRMIVHFMQPHHPYIGFRPNFGDKRMPEKCPPFIFTPPWPKGQSWYSYLVSHDSDSIRKLYLRNLRMVLPWIGRLCRELGGQTIVTADHGEAFGEPMHPLFPLKVYEHPPNIRMEVLVKVPWYIVKYPRRRLEYLEGAQQESTITDEEESVIEERLKALGYD